MRNSNIAWCSTLLLTGALGAAPATQPATTQPADVAHDTAVVQPIESQTLLVLPFSESAGANYPWIGRAMQQDLLADLSRTTRARVTAPANQPAAADAAAAVKAGRDLGATLVVYGQYQIVGNQARVTGQIVDVNTEKPGGSFNATGKINDLFPVEDAVSGQLLRALPPGWLTVALPPVNENGQVSIEPHAAPVAPQPPATAQLPQYYSYTYPDYASQYPSNSYYSGDYPYYGYAVPYYGPDIWFYGGWDFYHHHYWDHGYYGHGFDHSYGPRGFGHAPEARPGGGGGGGFHGGGGGGGSHGGGGHR